MSAGHALDFILAPIVFPLEWLQIDQVIGATLRNGNDVIDLPAVPAARVSEILTDDGPTPGINAKGLVNAHGPGLLPDGLDDLRAELIAVGICVRLSLHS